MGRAGFEPRSLTSFAPCFESAVTTFGTTDASLSLVVARYQKVGWGRFELHSFRSHGSLTRTFKSDPRHDCTRLVAPSTRYAVLGR